MGRINHAPTTHRSAPLVAAFGRSYAIMLFGHEAIDSLARVKVGPNKGKPRGHVIWRVTTAAGYHPNAQRWVGAGVVVRAWVGVGPMSHEDGAMPGIWLGRMQQLCGSIGLLSAEYRAQHAAEQERHSRELRALGI